MADVIEKYLCLYGESECRALEGFPAHYKHCLVLPLYRESPQALGRFCHTASQQGHTLIIAVINRPDNDDNQAWAIQINDQLIAISDQACAIWHSPDHSTLWSLDNHSGLLIVDRCIEGDAIPVKQGVGLARKIGADIIMAFDEDGQADTRVRKYEICKRAYHILVDEIGFPPEDIIFDPNIFAVATGIDEHNNYAVDFIEAVADIKQNLPYAMISGGVSTVSFSFRGNNPVREAIHAVFIMP